MKMVSTPSLRIKGRGRGMGSEKARKTRSYAENIINFNPLTKWQRQY
jgi:hypothetical protein